MINQFLRLSLATILLLTVVLSCKKTDTDVTAIPALNCSATNLSTTNFTNSNSAQSTTLTVGLSNATAGSATFTLASSSADFSPTAYTTTLTAGQSSVTIPLTFDGSSTVSSETITVTSSYASGTCTAIATISTGTSSTTAWTMLARTFEVTEPEAACRSHDVLTASPTCPKRQRGILRILVGLRNNSGVSSSEVHSSTR